MSVSEKLTNLANELRTQYGTTGKYTLDDMAKGIKGLETKNYFDAGQTKSSNGSALSNSLTVDIWNKEIAGQRVSFSFDLEWSGLIPSSTDFIGFELCTTGAKGDTYYDAYSTPQTASGKTHVVTTYAMHSEQIQKIRYCNVIIRANAGVKATLKNFKMVLNPMGGVADLLLFATLAVRGCLA